MLKGKYLIYFFTIIFIVHSCTGGTFDPVDPEEPDPNEEFGVPCPGLATVVHYGKTYNTVQIGNQCWLKENIDVGTMIPSNEEQTDNGVIEKFCYDNDVTNCDKYGGLYEWDEVMEYTIGEKSQGLCPDGFHIPTDDEFKELEGGLDSNFGPGNAEWDGYQWRGFDAGGKLKATGVEHWDESVGATNSSGFSALPHCYREWNAPTQDAENQFSGYRAYLCLWTSTENDETTVKRRALSYHLSGVYRSNHDKNFGYSLRCIKD